jgi:predicted transcriptional regulator
MTMTATNEAASVIREFQSAAPVDVMALAMKLGLSVWSQPLEDHIQGKIIRDEKHGGPKKYSIIVNSKEDALKQRFTIAHEIGHFILHEEKIGDGLTDDALYNSGLSTLEEVQANRMAGEILMPFTLIETAIKSGLRSLDDISAYLDVSKQALANRLQIPS